MKTILLYAIAGIVLIGGQGNQGSPRSSYDGQRAEKANIGGQTVPPSKPFALNTDDWEGNPIGGSQTSPRI